MASQYGGNIKYGIEFTPIGTGLNSVKSSLNQIHTLANNLFKGINPQGLNLTKQQIQESITAVNQLEMAFTKAFNPQLGTINLQTFNNAIANSGTTLSQIQAKMAQLGTSGTTAFRSITAELLTTNMRMKETSTLMTKMRDTFANTLRWTLASTAINTVTTSVRKAYSYTKELDKSLNNIMIVTDKSADNMVTFARQANKAAKELGATTTEYTNASLIYYQQGLSDAETAARTEVTLKAANVTKQSADAVSEQLTAVWNGYKVSAQETEKYIDKLAAVAATTASDLEELSVGMSRVASAANIMGVDVDQLNAQLSTIISVTREAPETIGTSLKTIFARMSDIEAGLDEDTTLGEYTQGMASLGFNVLDANDKLRDMGDVIEEIGGKWSSLSREQQVSLAQTMAGTRQYSRLLALFDNWGMYEKALKTSQGSLGTLQKQQDIYMGSMEAHLDQLKASTEGLYSSLFESDSLNSWTTGFTKFIELLDNFVQGIGGGGNVLQGLLTGLMFMFSTKIATGIANMSGNMQAATQESFRLVESQKLLNSLQTTNDSVIQDMVAMKQKMLDLNHVMNDSERNLSDSLIKELDIQSRITEEVKEKQALLNQTVQSQTGKTFTGTNQDEINTILKQKEDSIKTLISSRGGLLESLTSDFNKGVRDNSKTFNLRTSEAQAQSKVQKAQNIYETEKGIFDKKYANIVLTKQGLPNKQYKGIDDNFINQYLKDKAKLYNMQEQVSQKEQTAAGLSQKLSKNLFNIQDVSQIQQARAALTEFQQGMQGVLKTSPEMSDALVKVNRSLDAYEVAVAKGGKGSSAARAAFGEVENALKELEKHGVQALHHTQKEMSQGYDKIGQNALLTAEQVKQAHANMEQALQKRAMINNVVQIAGGISQITFGINSLRSAISALSNEDLNPFERMLQFTMGISMALPMVVKGFQGLSAALKLNGTLTGLSVKMSNARTLAVIKETGSIEAKTKAEIIEGKVRAGTMTQYEAEIALSNIATISNYKLATSSKVAAAGMKTLWASLGPIALILAVVVAAIYIFYKALSYKTPLEKAQEKNENLKKSVEELTTAYENAKNAYEDLISTLEDYEESKTAIDVLTQGTEAWGEAIEKNNRLVLDLMSKYEGLGKYVSDINGELVISEEGLSYVKQEQEKEVTESDYRRNLAQYGYNLSASEVAMEQYKESGALSKMTFDEWNDILQSTQQDIISQLEDSLITFTDAQEGTLSTEEALDAALGVFENISHSSSTKEEAYKAFYEHEFGKQFSSIENFVETLDKYQKMTQEDSTGRTLYAAEYIQPIVDEIIENGSSFLSDSERIANVIGENNLPLIKALQDNSTSLIDLAATIQGNNASNKIIANQLAKTKIQQYDENILNKSYAPALQALVANELEINKDEYDKIYSERLATGGEALLKLFNEKVGMAGYSSKWDKDEERAVFTNLQNPSETFSYTAEQLATELTMQEDFDEKLLKSWNETLQKAQDTIYSDVSNNGLSNATGFNINKILSETMASGDSETLKAATQEEIDYLKQMLETDKVDELFGGIKNSSLETLTQLEDRLGQLIDTWNSETAAEQRSLIANEETASIIKDGATQLEMSEEALEGLTDEIIDENAALKDNKQAAARAAVSLAKFTKGADELQSAIEDNLAVLEKWDEDVVATYEAAGEIQKAIEEMFGVQVDADFVHEHLAKIQKMANGDVAALRELEELLAKEHIFNLNILQEDKDTLNQMIEDILNLDTDLSIGASVEFDDSTYISKLNEMLENSEITTEQVQGLFNSLGYSPDIKMKTIKPSAPTETKTVTKTRQLKDDGAPVEDSEITTESVIQTWQDIQVPYIATEDSIADGETPGSGITKVSSSSSRASSIKANKNKKGSSSSDSKKKELKDEIDIYHDINREIEKLTRNIEKLNAAREKMVGGDIIKNINKENQQLQAQNNLYKNKIKMKKDEAQNEKDSLIKQGVKFDKDGNITNYNDIIAQKVKYINSLYDNGASDEKINAAEKDYENFKESLENYETITDEDIPDLQQQLQDGLDKIVENNIQKFTLDIELGIELKDIKKEWRELQSEVFESDDNPLFQFNNATKGFTDIFDGDGDNLFENTVDKMNTFLGEYQKIKDGGVSDIFGTDAAAALGKIEDTRSQLFDMTSELLEYIEVIEESIKTLTEEISQTQDDIMSTYDMALAIIEHQRNVGNILYGDSFDTSELDEEEFQKRLDKITKEREEYVKTAEEANKLKDALPDESDPEYNEKFRDYVEKAVDANEILSDLMGDVEETLELLNTILDNQMNKALDLFERTMTADAFEGWSTISDRWEKDQQLADVYLSTVNQEYEIQKLMNKINDDLLDKQYDSLYAQQAINKFKETELAMLMEKDKLTEAEVKRANQLYELTLLQIALEEARNNKSSMKLKRDSQGNYTYQYVADNEAIAKAEQDILDKQNEIYNESVENAIDNIERFNDAGANMQDQLQSLYESDNYQEYLGMLVNGETNSERFKELQGWLDESLGYIASDADYLMSSAQQSAIDNISNILKDAGFTDVDLNKLTEEQRKVLLSEGIDLQKLTALLNYNTQSANDNLSILYDAINSSVDAYVENTRLVMDTANTGEDTEVDYYDNLDLIKLNTDDLRLDLEEQKEKLKKELDGINQKYETEIKPLFAEMKGFFGESGRFKTSMDTYINSLNTNLNEIKQAINTGVTTLSSSLGNYTKAIKATTSQGSSGTGNTSTGNDSSDDSKDSVDKDKPTTTEKTYQSNLQVGDRVKYKTGDGSESWIIAARSGNTIGMYNAKLGLTRYVTLSDTNKLTELAWDNSYMGAKVFGPNNKEYYYLGKATNSGSYYLAGHYNQSSGTYGDGFWVNKTKAKEYYIDGPGFSDNIKMSSLATGGYTGQWPNGSIDGRWALLHQKELILNEQDTPKILDAVKLVREMTTGSIISDMQKKMNNLISNLENDLIGTYVGLEAAAASVYTNGQALEQQVHIDATFPNVKDAKEIEAALNNLVNVASQYATEDK